MHKKNQDKNEQFNITNTINVNLKIFLAKIAPESLLHHVRIQQFWKRGPMLLFANFYPIYTQILLNCRTPPWSASVH